MTEKKFRGWDRDLKQWFYGGYHKHILRQPCPINDKLREEDIQHLIIIDSSADWNLEPPIKVLNSIDPLSLGQYSGYKDKNGIEIYEGDVIRCRGGECYQGVYEFDDVFIIYEVFDAENIVRSYYECSEIEVIGNVFENPELRKQFEELEVEEENVD